DRSIAQKRSGPLRDQRRPCRLEAAGRQRRVKRSRALSAWGIAASVTLHLAAVAVLTSVPERHAASPLGSVVEFEVPPPNVPEPEPEPELEPEPEPEPEPDSRPRLTAASNAAPARETESEEPPEAESPAEPPL